MKYTADDVRDMIDFFSGPGQVDGATCWCEECQISAKPLLTEIAESMSLDGTEVKQ